MGDIVELEKYKNSRLVIICPCCKRKQTMVKDIFSNVWYPFVPFCCDVMRNADTVEWNKQLDKAIDDQIMLNINDQMMLDSLKEFVNGLLGNVK